VIRLEDFEWMLHYQKTLDAVNAKILEGLGKHNPRNLLAFANKIGLPPTTVAFRVKSLIKNDFLAIRAKLNSHKLGLSKAVLIAEINHGQADVLFRAIENIGYWTYISRCYGRFNGFLAVFSFPYEYKKELKEYLEKAKQTGALSRCELLWTTNIHEVAPNFDLFDFRKRTWSFPWTRWINEVSHSSNDLPHWLDDPESYDVQVDYIDLLILKELEKSGLEDFTKISKVAKITPQAVRHRFQEHLIKRNLVAEYEVAIFPYPLPISEMCAFVLDFPSKHALARFANTLDSKPFVVNYAKTIGQNSLLVHFYVPKTEFPNLVEALNSLTAKEQIGSFFYVSIDVPSFRRQTVSYEYFHDGKWAYDQEEQIKKLTSLLPVKLKAQASAQ
jgi:DNA-binding Lrp family transcriptional regulator